MTPRIVIALVAAALLAAMGADARAQAFRLESASSFRYGGWYSNWGGTASDAVFAEDLLLDTPRCTDCRLTLHAGMRLEADAGLGSDEAARFTRLDRAAARLHYAYLDWQPVTAVEVKAGRMIRYDPDAFLAIDGVALTLMATRRLGVEASFGMAVRERWPLGYQAPALDGVFPEDRPMTMLTTALVAAGAGGFGGRVQYRRAFDGQVQKEDIGAAVHIVPFRVLSASAAIEYSLVLQRLDYVIADGTLPLGSFSLNAGYARRNPTFIGSSIFNWFNVSPYDEARAGVSWAAGGWKNVAIEYRFRVMRADGVYLGVIDPAGRRLLVGKSPGLGGYAYDNGGAVTVRRAITAPLETGLALTYDEGAGGRRASAIADARYRARSWLSFGGTAGGSTFADDSPVSYGGGAVMLGADTEVRVGPDTSFALALDETYVSFYGWMAYATASIKTGFDILK